MELRQYWNVISKRRWLVLAIIALAGLFSAYSYLTTPKAYNADAKFAVRQAKSQPTVPGAFFTFNDYYNWIASEYLVDDYTQFIESSAFGSSVLDTMKRMAAENKLEAKNLDKLKADIDKLKPTDIPDAMGAERRHRELRVFAVTSSPDLAKAMMDATAVVLTTSSIQPIQGKLIDQPVLAQLDAITFDTISTSAPKEITNAITRVIMGIVAAIAIAFLLEYLDNSVRDEKDARKVLDLPVLGAIPRI